MERNFYAILPVRIELLGSQAALDDGKKYSLHKF